MHLNGDEMNVQKFHFSLMNLWHLGTKWMGDILMLKFCSWQWGLLHTGIGFFSSINHESSVIFVTDYERWNSSNHYNRSDWINQIKEPMCKYFPLKLNTSFLKNKSLSFRKMSSYYSYVSYKKHNIKILEGLKLSLWLSQCALACFGTAWRNETIAQL